MLISQQGMVSAQFQRRTSFCVFQFMGNIGVLRIRIWHIFICDVIELITARA